MFNGFLEFMFNWKSVFECLKNEVENLKFSLEDLEFVFIDYGLEELEEVEDKIIIRGDYNSFKFLNEGFESLKLFILKVSL